MRDAGLAHLIHLAQKSSSTQLSLGTHPVQVLGPFEFAKIEVLKEKSYKKL